MSVDIKGIRCIQNPVGVQQLMTSEQNDEVSDTTGDAMKNCSS